MTRSSGFLMFFTVLTVACSGSGASEGGSVTDGTAADRAEDQTAGGETETSETGRDELAMIRSLIVPPETPWSEMSREDRGTEMVMRFEPVFRVLFQANDADENAHFGCASCHGEDMEEREYEMPSAHLPPVPAAGSDAYRQMAEAHPNTTRFMEEEVMPAMQTMLGVGAAFTCHGCHPMASE